MKSLKSFGNFSLKQKFFLLAVLWLVLVSIPTISYWDEIDKQIGLYRFEQQGLAPAQLMLNIIQRSQQHRALTAAYLRDDAATNAALKKERRAKAEELEETIVDLEDYARKIKNQKIEKALAEVTADWHEISQHVTVRDISSEQSVQLHADLIHKQFNTLQMIVDSYQLSRDPEPAGNFLIAPSLYTAPELAEILAQFGVAGAIVLSQGEANFSDRVELKSLMLLSQEKLLELDSGIARATTANPLAKESLQQAYAKTRQHYQSLMSIAQDEILSRGSFSYVLDDFNKVFNQGMDSYYDFMRFSITQMGDVLKKRIEMKQQELSTFALKIFLLTLLVICVSFWFVRKWLQKIHIS